MRHIVSLSGGRDSTAMAIMLGRRLPDMELVFADTGRELPEVYDYVYRVAYLLRKDLISLAGIRGQKFEDFLKRYHYFLPTAQARWCTKELKVFPFDRHVNKSSEPCTVYVGLRADESDRLGHFGLRSHVTYAYPLIQEGVVKADIRGIIERASLELPEYYKWRSAGGCWCCFFQRKLDWAGLRMFHPNLFEQAVKDEEESSVHSKTFFGWRGNGKPLNLIEAAWQPPLQDEIDEWEYDRPCLICAK